MGVRRAVDLAFEEARKAAENGNPAYTLGPLIHNPKVLADLKTAGIKIIDENSINTNNDNANNEPITANCSLIIRAHGISPLLENELRDIGCRIVDATCPKVKANQLKIRELIRDGYFIFLAGEARHAEIEGLMGYALETAPKEMKKSYNDTSLTNCVLIGNAEEARKEAESQYLKNKTIKTALLSQTTISEDEYKAIGEEIKKRFPDLKIVNTICSATSERQQALREILPLVDAVIIAGGEESANTRRLFSIAKESGKPCALAENAFCGEVPRAKGIPEEFFKFETVGISAGASTPDAVVEEIKRFLKKN